MQPEVTNAESEATCFKKWARSKWTQVRSVSVKDAKAKKKNLLGKINEYVLAANRGHNSQNCMKMC